MDVKYSRPERYVPHRWLSVYTVTCDIIRMFDALKLFYYSFLPDSEKQTYQDTVSGIFEQYDISSTSQQGIKRLQKQMSGEKMTQDGTNRKKRIFQKLFYTSEKTRLELKIYGSVLPMLKKYVMMFQSSEPLIHKLNDKQQELLLDFLSCFIRPEVLRDISSRSLKQLDICDKANQLPQKDIHLVGNIMKGLHAPQANELIKQLREGYVKCGQKLQQRMPVNNKLLRCASAIDPHATGHTITMQRLLQLPKLVTNIFDKEEIMSYEQDVRRFQSQAKIPCNEERIDSFWASVKKTGEYPHLSKMALALVSCFHGPAVESSFSIMGGVLGADKAKMYIKTFSSIQTVKYHLKSEKSSACKHFSRPDVINDPVDVKLCRNMKRAYKEYQEDKAKEMASENEKRLTVGITKQSVPVSKAQSRKELMQAAEKIKQKHLSKVKRLGDTSMVKGTEKASKVKGTGKISKVKGAGKRK